MKRLLAFFPSLALSVLAAVCVAENVTNTVVMVDQNKNLNVEGVASVQAVASNEVRVAIAQAEARAAQSTATSVSNEIQGVVGNIMSNNVVIYRSGFTDAFASLVVFTDDDILAINGATFDVTASAITCNLSYVTTANLGAVKPLVYAHNTLTNREDFEQVPDADVTSPVYHAESVVYQGQTFSGYYTFSATISNPSSTASYFLWIKASGDTPSGEGMTLDLPNGVTGGETVSVEWGGYLLNFVGGVLRSHQDAN